jgi:hypothetical protein
MKIDYVSPPLSLARRALELSRLNLDGARITIRGGRELIYAFHAQPGPFGRIYDCRLHIRPDSTRPEMIVVDPNLDELAGGDSLPHTYKYTGKGVKLCLWWPKRREWMPRMSLADTYIPWTFEWLDYFEEWLITKEWSGGGVHPDPKVKRWQRTLSFTPEAAAPTTDG